MHVECLAKSRSSGRVDGEGEEMRYRFILRWAGEVSSVSITAAAWALVNGVAGPAGVDFGRPEYPYPGREGTMMLKGRVFGVYFAVMCSSRGRNSSTELETPRSSTTGGPGD